MLVVESFAATVLLLRELLLLAAIGLALSGLDDLFLDCVFLFRRIGPGRDANRATLLAGSADPGWMAILVPAWDEADVIGPMLAGLTRALDYARYRVFVGVYPNDPATHAAVSAVGDARIEVVTTVLHGPTTKADCLNHLWRAAEAFEAAEWVRFKAIVLHDAEDVVHPAELRVFDALIPGLAMVQLPVVPFVDEGSRWVGGHYLDEFAEGHAKDVVVREALGAAVPLAGVACAIERGHLAALAGAAGEPFDPTCFTEDYELGLRIQWRGGRGALVRVRDASGALVATREYFPATLADAVRQKSRWVLGIALSGWDRLGWDGTWADRYMLWRDRKPIFTAPLLLAAYAGMIGSLAVAVVAQCWPPVRALVPVAPQGGALAALLEINTALAAWRLTARAAFTADLHGWREGVRAVPRAVVANLVNTLAMARALQRYAAITLRGHAGEWEKTRHRIPEPAL